jgi:hypothetical protein
MAIRLALEAPSRFRAVAAVSASVPTPENFRCKPAERSASIMIMNGTQDPFRRWRGKPLRLVLQELQGSIVTSVGPIFCGPQPDRRRACNDRDQRRRRCSRRAGALAKRPQRRSGTGCDSRRRAWHPAAVPGPSAPLGSVALGSLTQGTEWTGDDLGLLGATAKLESSP